MSLKSTLQNIVLVTFKAFLKLCFHLFQQPGDCICKPGFGGRQCNDCAFGYYGYPYCKPCPCNPAGSVDPSRCDGNCLCKVRITWFQQI